MNSAKEINIELKNTGKRLWQRNYCEHVIRGEKDMKEKREYISNNAIKWEMDEYNPANK